jgi:hypothetical protein
MELAFESDLLSGNDTDVGISYLKVTAEVLKRLDEFRALVAQLQI